jgi:D-sedoheptulose 7-phosphate isomerase
MTIKHYLEQSCDVLNLAIQDEVTHNLLDQAIHAVVLALAQGLPLLVCGNGGSASDAQHIAGELVGRFLKERRGYNVICLADNAAILTAVANDYAYDQVFSRQVQGYGKPGAVILGLTTSGNSANVIKAFEEAKSLGMITIAMTGATGGKIAPLSDYLIKVPSTFTPQIQQIHLCFYHYFCDQVEQQLENLSLTNHSLKLAAGQQHM